MKDDIKKTAFFHKTTSGYFDFCLTAKRLLECKMTASQTPVFLCIGSDRMTGDCLGPLVGHKLKALYPKSNHIFGTLEQPVHAGNLQSSMETIYNNYENPFFVAIDASLGYADHIGSITLSNQGIVPGKGLKKSLPYVGDMSVTGIVNLCSGNTSLLLQNTRLHLVNELSDFIFMGLSHAFAAYLSD